MRGGGGREGERECFSSIGGREGGGRKKVCEIDVHVSVTNWKCWWGFAMREGRPLFKFQFKIIEGSLEGFSPACSGMEKKR